MAYFLRFTENAIKDLKKGTSIHSSDLKTSEYKKKQAAQIFGCNPEYVGRFNGNWCQILDGLCGYALLAETLEEAIEEVESNSYQFENIGKAVIYSGRYSSQGDLVPDGDLFYPFEILHIFN